MNKDFSAFSPKTLNSRDLKSLDVSESNAEIRHYYKKELLDKINEIEALKEKIREIKARLSWKLSSPIRELERFINKNFKNKDKLPGRTDSSLDVADIYTLEDIDPYDVSIKDEPSPKISIVIPIFNQLQHTINCINSIVENSTYSSSYEIIIADDSSDPSTIATLSKIKNLKMVSGENVGFIRNCNRAAKTALGDYLVFLNNDTLVTKGWLESLLLIYSEKNDVGMVGAKLIYPNLVLQEAGAIIWSDANGWNYGRNGRQDKNEYNYVREVDYCSGACIMIETSLFKQVNGFSEEFCPAYYEDSDLSMKLRQIGKKTYYQPNTRIIHFEGISHGKDESSGLKQHQAINKERFLHKWKDVLEKEHEKGPEKLFRARERGKSSKYCLFLDHDIPTPDKDAGSKSVFSIIDLFCYQGIKLKMYVCSQNGQGLYGKLLEQMGVELLLMPLIQLEKWLREYSSEIDFVFISRPEVAEKYVSLVRKYTSAKIIFYGHDIHYLRNKRAMEYSSAEVYKNKYEYYSALEPRIWKEVDAILYPSTYEVELVKKIAPEKQVEHLPLCVFGKIKEKIITLDSTSGLLFVGGFGHPPNALSIKWFIAEVWETVKKAIPDCRLTIIGSAPTPDVLALASDDINVLGWVPEEKLLHNYETHRISIVPLLYGAGAKGKVLDALYNGLPIVTTTIGAEGFPDLDQTVLIADSAEEFAKKIISLYHDETRLNQLCRDGKNYIRNNFSPETVWSALQRCLS